MHPRETAHLTADDLDAVIGGTTSPDVASHLATCRDCVLMVQQDRRLVAALSALPHYDARPDFADRVIGGLAARSATAAATDRSPRATSARRRVIGGVALAAGSMATGFAWAASHPADALRWSGPALDNAGRALWVSLQAVVANITAQPWYAALHDTMTTPWHALLVLGAFAGAYAIALTSLRRLMAESATDARW